MSQRLHRLGAIASSFIIATSFAPILSGVEMASAQIVRSEGVWRTVYEQLPDLPRENQYINKETGKVATEDTLVGRLIRYHLYVKGRPPFYRLDWKLTLADYLGLSGLLNGSEYPGAAKLKSNPVEGDVAAIRKLNRAQRDALVQALVNGFVPQSQRSPSLPPSPQPPVPNS
jgi:hypothetical protein